MHSMKRNLATLMALALWAGPVAVVLAGAKAPPAGADLQDAITWYDGERQYTAWVNPKLVAEFTTPGAQESAVARANPKAAPLPGRQGMVRLWQVEDAAATLRSTRAATPAARLSPVLHDAGSSSGRMRALPGDILVTFRPEWSEAEVRQWAAGHKLTLGQKLAVSGNIYVVQCEPGLAAVDLANSIHRSGEVVSAMPNWWQEVSHR